MGTDSTIHSGQSGEAEQWYTHTHTHTHTLTRTHTHTHTHTHTVGSMLAHLHTLESENRQMQSKIMELASQREFYIAINTKLRHSLAEQDTGNRLPNGIRDEPSHDVHMTTAPRQRASSKKSGNSKSRPHIESSDTQRILSNEVISPNRLSKDVQDSLLKEHFQATTTTGLFTGHRSDSAHNRANSKPAYSHAPIQGNDHNITQPPKGSSPGRSYQAKPSMVSEQTENFHEITRVTNSVQAPIPAFTQLPRDSCQDVRMGDINVT